MLMDTDEHCLNWHTKSGFEEYIEFIGPRNEGAREPLAAEFLNKCVDGGAKMRLMKKIGLQKFSLVKTTLSTNVQI